MEMDLPAVAKKNHAIFTVFLYFVIPLEIFVYYIDVLG